MTSSGSKEIGHLSPNNDNTPAYFLYILLNVRYLGAEPSGPGRIRKKFPDAHSERADPDPIPQFFTNSYLNLFPFVIDFIFISIEKFYDGLKNLAVVLLCTLNICIY
jgi:hypothetical protein